MTGIRTANMTREVEDPKKRLTRDDGVETLLHLRLGESKMLVSGHVLGSWRRARGGMVEQREVKRPGTGAS